MLVSFLEIHILLIYDEGVLQVLNINVSIIPIKFKVIFCHLRAFFRVFLQILSPRVIHSFSAQVCLFAWNIQNTSIYNAHNLLV